MLGLYGDKNVNRYLEKKHADKYKKRTFYQTQCNLQYDNINKATYVLSHIIAKNKSFSEFKNVWWTLELYEKVSLSRRTVTRLVEDIVENLEQQLKGKVKDFALYSLALDESCDVQDTGQLLIFL